MRIDVERVYKIKMFENGGEVDDNNYSPQEIEINKELFADSKKLDDKNGEYSVQFIFEKEKLKEIQIKTKYIDVKEQDITDIQSLDEKTIIKRVKSNLKNKDLKDSLILVYLKEDKRKKTVSKTKDNKLLWKWRFDSFCIELFKNDLVGLDNNVYRAIKEFLFGYKNGTKSKF